MDTKLQQKKRLLILFAIIIAAAAVLATIIIGVISLVNHSKTITVSQVQTEEQKPEPPLNTHSGEFFYGENTYLQYRGETQAHLGIDVSSHQTEIDWQKVSQTPVEFAIIRIGYRGYTEGNINQDTYYEPNMQGAAENGIPTGVYFFSQATTIEEAVEEADFVLSVLNGAALSYPVFFDWENIEPEARTDGMTGPEVTACAKAFCERIEENGYRAGVYFNRSFGYQQYDLLQLQAYPFWLADYSVPSNYRYHYDFLQYSNIGFVDGIPVDVDMNLAFD